MRLILASLFLFCLPAFGQVPIRSVDNVAALIALNPQPYSSGNRLTVTTMGYYTPGDGGGQEFRAVESEAATNLGTVFASGRLGWQWHAVNWDGNVRKFGAKGDGVANDTAAIRAATAAALTSKRLYLPGGTYNVASGAEPVILVATDGMVIVGDGAERTIIDDNGSGYVVQFGDGVANHQRNVLEKLRITGNANTEAAIKAKAQSCYNTIRDVFIQEGKIGIDAKEHCWGYTLDQVDIIATGIGIIQGNVNPHWQYFASKIRYCTDVGLLATNQSGANRPFMQTWYAGTISHCRRGIIMADAREFRFHSIYLEDNGGNDDGPSVLLNSLSRGITFDRPFMMLQNGDGFEVSGLGHEINQPGFFSVPAGTRGIYLTSAAAFCTVNTDKYGTWSRGSGGSITATAGTGSGNSMLLADYTIANGGSGYSSNTTAYVTGGSGNRARITLQVSSAGVITNLVIADPGTGYTSAPTITINDWDEVLVDAGFRTQINGITIDKTANAGEQPQLIPQAGVVLNNADSTMWYVGRDGLARSLRPTLPARDDIEDFGSSTRRWRYISGREFFGYGYGEVPSITFRRANGPSPTEATNIVAADAIGGIYWTGATNAVPGAPDWLAARSAIVSWAHADWSATSNPTYMTFEVTGNNQLDRLEALRIEHDRNITWTASAPVLDVVPTNNASGLRINFPTAHGNDNILRVQRNGTTFFTADANASAGNVGIMVWQNGTLHRVTVGANDSGGTGFRALRIPN